MRRAKKWLLLLGTVLVVAGAAVLPQSLSQARDRTFFHQVSVDAVEDTLFSPVNDLFSRIKFFARWQLLTDAPSDTDVLSFSQEVLPQDLSKVYDRSLVEHSSDLEQRALDALRNLAEEVPQLEPLLPQAMPELEGTQLTILDWDTNEIAYFLQFLWMDQGHFCLQMTMDESLEKVISLVIPMPQLSEWEEENAAATREEIIRAFFGYLGMTGEGLYQVREDVNSMVVNTDSDTDADIAYYIYLNQDVLSIQPLTILPGESVDNSSHSETEAGQAVDQDGDPITVIVERNDVDLMQKP